MKHSDLPAAYGDNVVVLLVQSPTVVFAYWDLTPAAWCALTRRGVFTVRFRRCQDPGAFTDVHPERRAGNWYFRGVAPGASYVCEVGCTEGGVFYPFLCSTRVDTPFNTPAPAAEGEVEPLAAGDGYEEAFPAPPPLAPLPGSGTFLE
ncbi:MAG: DUF4912 domain-containing protein [Bacillota bacterium]